MRQVLATVRRDGSGQIAMMRQTREMEHSAGTIDGDNSGFVNIPLTAREVLVAVYMREVEPGKFRASLRSKGNVNVAKVAEKFGGGGHKNAAGLGVEGDWQEKEREIVEAVRQAIASAEI